MARRRRVIANCQTMNKIVQMRTYFFEKSKEQLAADESVFFLSSVWDLPKAATREGNNCDWLTTTTSDTRSVGLNWAHAEKRCFSSRLTFPDTCLRYC
jgi:hypothetical protein